MSTHSLIKSVITPLFLFISATANGATVLLADGDFSNWQIDNSFQGGTATRVPTGGNPDAYLSLTAGTIVASVMTSNPALVYDPAADGPVSSFSFSADIIGISDKIDTAGDSVPQFAFSVVQDGNPYWYNVAFNTTSWTTITTLDLVAADFASPFIGGVPDFSSSASPLYFGIVAGVDYATSMNFSVDNYQVTVNTVPVPPALLLFSSGLMAVGFATARNKKS